MLLYIVTVVPGVLLCLVTLTIFSMTCYICLRSLTVILHGPTQSILDCRSKAYKWQRNEQNSPFRSEKLHPVPAHTWCNQQKKSHQTSFLKIILWYIFHSYYSKAQCITTVKYTSTCSLTIFEY